MRKSLLEQLTAAQRKAVLHIEGPLLVLAGPGSGKTRVITYRIASLINSGVNPYNICAITFTNKAAKEMQQRSLALGSSRAVHLSTFHSLCVRILRKYGEQIGIKSNFSIFDTRDQSKCMKEAIKRCNYDTKNFTPGRMLSAVSTLKNKLIDAEDSNSGDNNFFGQILSRVYEKYQGLLESQNAVDFDDLLFKVAILLRDFPDIRQKLSDRYKYLLIDEYQDTNHAQYRIAKDLASCHSNICVTGDPDQSIYRWRGADIGNILMFEKDWPEALVVRLEENFRSTAKILEAADRLIGVNQFRKSKTLIATKESGSDIIINGYENEAQEAFGVAQKIKELINKNVRLNQVAVFYRVNSMSRAFEEAFVKNKIPYQIVRGIEFYNRKEIRDMIGYLKVIVNPEDETALMRIINTPARGIGKTTIERIRAYAAIHGISFFGALKSAEKIEILSRGTRAKIAVFAEMIKGFQSQMNGGAGKFLETIFKKSGLAQSLKNNEDNDAIENVGELINSASQYDKNTEQPGIADYLQQISLFSDTDNYDTEVEKVAFMTLHAAKGLEFDNVFVVGIEEGILPHERSGEDEEEKEEERRLLFVGMTRARTRLELSYCRYRTIRGMALRSVVSPFLYELGVGFHDAKAESAEKIYYDDEYSQDFQDQPAKYAGRSFSTGQLVSHNKFGLGRVKKYHAMGENSTITIQFNTGQIKTLMLKYANLIKMQ